MDRLRARFGAASAVALLVAMAATPATPVAAQSVLVAAPTAPVAEPGAPVAQPMSAVGAPRLFVDLGLRGKNWPSGGSFLLGPTLGVIVRPFDKCLHLSADLFAGFAEAEFMNGFSVSLPDGVPQPTFADVVNQLYALSLGALWGNGDADSWVGAGAVIEGGLARLETGTSDDSGLSLDAALRAQLRHRLRKQFWVFVDLRVGHTLVKREPGGLAPSQVGPVLAIAVGASLAP